jgi:chromosome segregation ATPase
MSDGHCVVLCFRKSGDAQVAACTRRIAELETKFEDEVARHEATRSELETLQTTIEEVKATADASRDENDALVAEIETLATEMDEIRHARKKLIQQIDEKRNSCKKLHSQVQREEQAKAQYFEEITAVRLQVSSLSAVHKHQQSVIDAAKVRA